MYLKKVEGPRCVTLPDGKVMSRADLPDTGTKRWVASRKAAVVRGVAYGLITQEEALELYGLSEEEFGEWVSAATLHGIDALKATAVQKYRQPEGESAKNFS
ncbi:DUF1153 domain-containing protein [Shimia abyssi]|uniref:Uncharacterized protein DUF1153 n=1 Tax=Shimia abyssi TaxID=1662395 RepID=A0A2P8F6P2_9RHOB|nr:DUF1153 domain-containing protein [Shimia abyssi]PSL17390.1 uncharacterized protein DUF1153 [Shimia abyssi]